MKQSLTAKKEKRKYIYNFELRITNVELGIIS